MKKYLGWMMCSAVLAGQSVWAAEVSFSGFGTLGYAQSDQPYNYQRFVNKSGTFKRDSMLVGQMDVRFNAEWGATVQGKLAPALANDQNWQARASWAFLSFRPSNDFLVRVGQFRMPMYMNSERMDIDAAFATAKLPIEVYALTASADLLGTSFVKTWGLGDNELSLEGYWGAAKYDWRFYLRDAATSIWVPLKVEAKGLLLTLHRDEDSYCLGLHQALIRNADGSSDPVTLTPVTLDPLTTGLVGSASGELLSQVPGLGFAAPARSRKMDMNVVNMGLDVGWGAGFRTIGEYARTRSKGTDFEPDGENFYLSVTKEVGHWTPYITYAQVRTRNTANYVAVNNARVAAVSPLIPAAVVSAINAGQRQAAEMIAVYDQHSWIVGTIYALTPKSKLKAEWSRVSTGVASNFVNAPVGGNSGNQSINVLALSYSFLF